ncbi:MAG: hypothetical protein HQL56_10260 [Magnetococcales bacterium]|nr:hypothetical protein [Magnetococcales bacterium]
MKEQLVVLAVILFIIYSIYAAAKKPSGRVSASLGTKSYSLSEIALTDVGTALGGAITIGYISLIFKGGLAFLYAGLCYLLGILMLYALIPTIRRISIDNNYNTIEDFISHGNIHLKTLVASVNLFTFLGLYVAQYIVLDDLLKIVMPEYYFYVYWVFLVGVGVYVAIYGFHGVLRSDFVQTIFVICWLACVSYVMYLSFDQIPKIADLPKNILDGTFYGKSFLIVVTFLFPLTVLARAEHWQRIVAAKDDDTSRKSFLILALVMFIVYLLLALAGLFLRVVSPNTPPNEAPYYFLSVISNEYFYAVAVLGIIAALATSADSFLNVCANSMKSLFWKGMIDRFGEMHIYRRCVFAAVILGQILMNISSDLGGWVVLASSSVVVIVPGYIWELLKPSETKIHSILSIYGGILCYIFVLSFGLLKIETAFIAGAVGSIVVYMMSRRLKGTIDG